MPLIRKTISKIQGSVETILNTISTTLTSIKNNGILINGGNGTKLDTSLTLTSATTVYSTTAPTIPYLLIVHNKSDTDVYFRFTTGTTLGTLLGTGKSLVIDMGASEVLYFYCADAGKVINYSTRANY